MLLRFSLVARTRTPFGTVCAGIGDGVCVGGLAGRVYVMAKGGLPCHPRTDVTYISRTVCVVLWRFGVLLFGTLAECSSFSFFQAGRVGHKRAPGFVRFCAVSLSTIFSSKRASVVVFVVGVPTDGRTAVFVSCFSCSCLRPNTTVPLHLHGKRAGHNPRPSQGPHGGHQAVRLRSAREGEREGIEGMKYASWAVGWATRRGGEKSW